MQPAQSQHQVSAGRDTKQAGNAPGNSVVVKNGVAISMGPSGGAGMVREGGKEGPTVKRGRGRPLLKVLSSASGVPPPLSSSVANGRLGAASVIDQQAAALIASSGRNVKQPHHHHPNNPSDPPTDGEADGASGHANPAVAMSGGVTGLPLNPLEALHHPSSSSSSYMQTNTLLHPYHYHLTFTSTDVNFVSGVCQLLTIGVSEVLSLVHKAATAGKGQGIRSGDFGGSVGGVPGLPSLQGGSCPPSPLILHNDNYIRSAPPGVLCGIACCAFFSVTKPDRGRLSKEMAGVNVKATAAAKSQKDDKGPSSLTSSAVAAAGLAQAALPPLPVKTESAAAAVGGGSKQGVKSAAQSLPSNALASSASSTSNGGAAATSGAGSASVSSQNVPTPVLSSSSVVNDGQPALKRERTNSFGLDAIAAASFILDSPSAGAASQKANDCVDSFVLEGGTMLGEGGGIPQSSGRALSSGAVAVPGASSEKNLATGGNRSTGSLGVGNVASVTSALHGGANVSQGSDAKIFSMIKGSSSSIAYNPLLSLDNTPILSAEQNTLLRTPLGFQGASSSSSMNGGSEMSGNPGGVTVCSGGPGNDSHCINIATDPWATCLSSQVYASLSNSESNKDCWERLGLGGYARDYRHYKRERDREKCNASATKYMTADGSQQPPRDGKPTSSKKNKGKYNGMPLAPGGPPAITLGAGGYKKKVPSGSYTKAHGTTQDAVTDSGVIDFMWEGRVIVRPPRCGEIGWEVDGVQVQGLNGGTVEGRDDQFDCIIGDIIQLCRSINFAKKFNMHDAVVSGGWSVSDEYVVEVPASEGKGDEGEENKKDDDEDNNKLKVEGDSSAVGKNVKQRKVQLYKPPHLKLSPSVPANPTTTIPGVGTRNGIPLHDAYMMHLKSLSDLAVDLCCKVRNVAVLGSRWKVVRSWLHDESSDEDDALQDFTPRVAGPGQNVTTKKTYNTSKKSKSAAAGTKRKSIDAATKHSGKGHQDPRPVTKGECNWCAPVSAPSSEANSPICASCKICQRLGWERRAKYRYKKGLANRGFFDVNYYDELGKHRGRSVKMFLQLTQSYVRYVLKQGGVDEHVARLEREEKGTNSQQKKKKRRSEMDQSRADEFV